MQLLSRTMLLAFAAALCISAAGCGSQTPTATSTESQSQTPTATSTESQSQEKRYQLKGTVISLDRAQHHVVVDHEEIPGFMSAMAMPYPVADDATLDRLAPGDQITGDVVVVPGNPPTLRLENVVVVKKADGAKTPTGVVLPHSLEGDAVPDFAFVNQDGARIGLHRYLGKALLVTFIYTRCPLADYCPLVTHHFAEIEKTLAKNPALYAKTHLLCISFDPRFDTPEALREYGRTFAPDKGAQTFAHLEFASVTEAEKKNILHFFNIFYAEEGMMINHSLRTAVISPDGKVFRSYNDNTWKPADLLADVAKLIPGQPS